MDTPYGAGDDLQIQAGTLGSIAGLIDVNRAETADSTRLHEKKY